MPDPADHEYPLETVDGVPVVRLGATTPLFAQAVERVAAAVRRMVAEGQPHLLVDVGNVAFDAPSLVDRLCMVRQWAEVAGGRLRIAMVARPEFIDPNRFGVVAAANFGLSGQVFEREADAIAWLRAEHEADLRRGTFPPAAGADAGD